MTELVKPPAKLKKRQLSQKQKQKPNFFLGDRGEQQALAFLQRHAYQILAQNVAFLGCEVDLIALDTSCDEIVFVEVKTRSTAAFGHPNEAVNFKKIRNMQKVASQWLLKHDLSKDYRFDIISILPGKIEHFQNITGGW